MPSLTGGGAERVLINLLRKIDYEKYQVDLLVIKKEGIYWDEVPQEVHIYILFNQPFLGNLLNKIHVKYNHHTLYKFLVNRLIKTRYDVGISFTDSSYTDVLFFLDRKIKKKISWIHASYKSYSNYSKILVGKYRERVIRERCSKLDEIVFVSHDAKNEYVDVFGNYKNMKVIYNIIDFESVLQKSVSESINYDNDITNFVAMGSLLPVKGYKELLLAAKCLNETDLSFKIRILGEGPQRKELEDLICQLNLTNQVELLGFNKNPYPYIKNSDIFVMTSVSEALPTALIEAMCLGLPVITTDCSGCREIVDNNKYGLISNRNPKEIAKNMYNMAIDKKLRDSYAVLSQERIKLFDEEIILNQFYELIDE